MHSFPIYFFLTSQLETISIAEALTLVEEKMSQLETRYPPLPGSRYNSFKEGFLRHIRHKFGQNRIIRMKYSYKAKFGNLLTFIIEMCTIYDFPPSTNKTSVVLYYEPMWENYSFDNSSWLTPEHRYLKNTVPLRTVSNKLQSQDYYRYFSEEERNLLRPKRRKSRTVPLENFTKSQYKYSDSFIDDYKKFLFVKNKIKPFI